MSHHGIWKSRLSASCLAVAVVWLGACGSRRSPGLSGAAGSGGSPSLGESAGVGGQSGGEPSADAGAVSVGGGAGVAGEAAIGGAAGEPSGGSAGAGVQGCSASAALGLAVFSPTWDALGYPPYAIDECTLVYVAASDHALRARSLMSGEERLLEPASSHPRRPTISGNVVGWENDGSDGSVVSVALLDRSDPPQRFDHAGEPRATSDALVFTRFLGSNPGDDTDVFLFDVTLGEVSAIASGPGQQRFADVSPSHVAVTDFSEDPKGYFDETGSIADIVLIERGTRIRTVRSAPGKQAFPLLGSDGVLVYLEWGTVHPEPKFGQFLIMAGNVTQPVSQDLNIKGGAPVITDVAYVRPSLRGLNLDYIDRSAGATQLYRAKLGTGAAPISAAIAGATELFGTASAEALTVVATPLQGQALGLAFVQR